MKLKRSIGQKMSMVMAGSLFVIISLFSHSNVRNSEKQLLAMAETEASKMSSAIKSSLEDAMLANTREGVQAIVAAVGQEAWVNDIKIVAVKGQVRYAKQQEEIGTVLDQGEESCALCHTGGRAADANRTVYFESSRGSRILRNVNPIRNQPKCHGCHDRQVPLLGKLLVDFSTDEIDALVSENRRMLISSTVVSLLASILICVLGSALLVKRPLQSLLVKMKSHAHLAPEREESEAEDEVALLDRTYDGLMAAIEARNRTIDEQMEEHLALFNVSEILNRSSDMEENINLILQALNVGFRVEECCVFLKEEAAGSLIIKDAVGLSEASYPGIIERLTDPGVKEQTETGEPFVVGGNEEERFLVAPLKAAGRVVGGITVHRLIDRQVDDHVIRRSFAIIATVLAPHVQVGICQVEKEQMRVSPFQSFVEAIDQEIATASEYFGPLSLALITVGGYDRLQDDLGVEAASARVQEVGAQLSAGLDVVHDCSRIQEECLALVLPMIEKEQAGELIHGRLAELAVGLETEVAIAAHPEDGSSGLELLAALREKL